MSMTDLLVIVVAVLFVLVLLDGLRRKWSDRSRVVLKLDRSMQGIDLSEEELTKSELPNGGARTKPRASDEIPRPPKPEPKLKVLKQGLHVHRSQGREGQAGDATGTAQALAGQSQPRHVPVLLDAVEVEEERIEHTNVFADSSAVPVSVVDNRNAVPDTQEETMGIYRDDIDASIQALDDDGAGEVTLADLTADLEPDRPLVAGRGDDDEEDDWEEDWDDADEDEDDDEADDEDGDALEEDELWEETWEEDEYDEDDDEDDDEDFDDDEEDEDDDYDDEDFDDDEEDEDEDDEDDEEPFPDYDDEDETWNRLTAAPHAAEPAVPRSSDRIEPAFGPGELDTWEFESEPDMGPATGSVAASAQSAAGTGAGAAGQERKSMFGAGFLSKKDQGELFREETPDDLTAHDEDAGQPQEVIVVNVMARPGQAFDGYELLPVLQLQGLRLGDMSIFHKHSGSNGTGTVLFSMANMVKPGTFDLATMGSFTTPGVSFFLQLPNKYGNMASFEQMLTAADAVRQALDGELKDENRSVLTRQTLEHYRQRIRDFELSLLARR